MLSLPEKGGFLMKLNHPAKRLTAALLSGAMLFTLSAPALAADPGTAPDAAPAAAAPLNEENGSEDVTFTIGGDDHNYAFTTDQDASFEGVRVSYTHADNTLTFTGPYDSLTIDAPGVNVKITGSPEQTLVGEQGKPNPLVLKITRSASVYISNLQDNVTSDRQAIAGTAEITCSGDVELKTTGDGPLVSPWQNASDSTLTYNQADGYAYEVWADNALLTDVGEAGTSFALSKDTTYSYIHIIPDVPAPIIPDDGGEGGDGAGIAGAVVAGVAIGGAAAWGSYEIATRVILNDLLPEGAAIPANRGQLALLVWNTAGRPAPAAAPAFADVTDPDTAAAAQWCVEQGLLDARKDGKFDPDAYTAKFRVIEVWNKAFPKQ